MTLKIKVVVMALMLNRLSDEELRAVTSDEELLEFEEFSDKVLTDSDTGEEEIKEFIKETMAELRLNLS